MCAARAAAEVDQLILGRSEQADGRPVVDALEKFVQLLKEFDVDLSESGSQKSLMDPTNSRIFVMASEHSKLASNVRSYVELGKVLRNIVRMLDDAQSQKLDAQSLERLRDFFIYLSDFAAAERRAFVSRPKQPYRR